jgi:hypothetical protein
MRFQNYPSVLNRKESFSIKEFLQKEKGRHEKVLSTSLKIEKNNAYSIVFNPLMLFDPNFILIGAGVILVAVIEKQLANNGFVFVAAAIDSILKIAFPIVAVGSMIYLLSHSSFLL